jgi:hypothetical protein
LKTVLSCPLGSKCEKMVDEDTKELCSWFIKIQGQDPQTGEFKDEYGCSMIWIPILVLEMARETRSMTAATESFRNEVVNVEENKKRVLEMAVSIQKSKLIKG